METAVALPFKEVAKISKQVNALQDSANALTIKNPKDLSAAADLRAMIKQAQKAITGRKESITRPLMQGLASLRDLFKPNELSLDNSVKVVDAKVVAYQTIQEMKIEKERARLDARVEKGTMTAMTAVKKFGELGSVTKSAEGEIGKIKTRMVPKVRIIDETLIPREFLTPNMQTITEAVLRQNIHIPGVEKIMEKVITS